MYRLLILVIAGVLSTGANAKPASSSFRVATVVPEFCQLATQDLTVSDENGILHGRVLEMCNGSSSYRIVAVHRELAEHERVTFQFANVEKSLQANGLSEITTRTGARYGERDVNVRYNSLRSPLKITLTITAH